MQNERITKQVLMYITRQEEEVCGDRGLDAEAVTDKIFSLSKGRRRRYERPFVLF